jgi:hypothetical protein
LELFAKMREHVGNWLRIRRLALATGDAAVSCGKKRVAKKSGGIFARIGSPLVQFNQVEKEQIGGNGIRF